MIAIYKGKKINLARGWAGAQVCTETNSGAVHCFDSAAQADRALATIDPAAAALAKKHKANLRPEVRNSRAAAAASCAYGWVCLYEHSNYTGRKLQWSQSGTKNLSDWNFRDQASAGCVNKQIGGALVYDARTGLPDPLMALGNGYCYNFVTASYPTGGNWNDKADYMEM
ncbi:peptidase inhibitor family I36 protein [Streptomyces sp. CAU 1734]|uniref:peptidase inhibitor family I36 protein n=1 Tax=Streptomyces sp. CAU 1734 TaxID=3140360 RepID=UPI00326072AF